MSAGTGGSAAICRAAAERLRTTSSGNSWITGSPAAGVIAAAISAAIAIRIDQGLDLVMFGCIVAVGMPLACIDILEQRLPHALLWPSYGIAATLMTVATITRSDTVAITRSIAAMALTSGFYLTLAVVSRGGLGAGDIKLGGLLGLTLGWHSWTSAFVGSVLGWVFATTAVLGLRLAGRWHPHSTLPLGPFLLAGAFTALALSG